MKVDRAKLAITFLWQASAKTANAFQAIIRKFIWNPIIVKVIFQKFHSQKAVAKIAPNVSNVKNAMNASVYLEIHQKIVYPVRLDTSK